MAAKPDAFLSYTRFDDRRGKISEFREWLSDAVEEVSGHPFDIFQDIEGIGLGEKWHDVLDRMLDQARFFIPILTPKFFNSRPCRDELTKFLDLERKTGRQDLVLPIYWITCPNLEEGHLKAKDDLAQAINERQHWDWRDLRLQSFEAKEIQRDLLSLGSQIERARRNVLRVVETPQKAVGGGQHELRPIIPKLKTVAPQFEPASKPEIKQPFEAFKDIDAPWCPEMLMLPAGSFLMGSPEAEKRRYRDEGPQHEVTISQPFALGRYAVTFDEYDSFCDQTGRDKPEDRSWGRGRRPVIYVSYDDAKSYCDWLSEITKARYQLPTEAMWEYACRAGTITRFNFGDEIATDQANFRGQEEIGAPQKGVYRQQTIPVGSLPANNWGFHEMHGNVAEWCADGVRIYTKDAVVDPQGPLGRERTIRGGSWLNDARFLRSAARGVFSPDHKDGDLGFRCARTYRK